MLTFDLNPMFKLRGVTRKYTYLKKIGLSHMVAQRFVAGDTKTMKTAHIELICLALKCTPNDLLCWTPEPNQPANADHPMHTLKKKEESLDVLAELRNLPLEKMDELRSFLKEIKKDTE